jgi:peroxiredoxin family protein
MKLVSKLHKLYESVILTDELLSMGKEVAVFCSKHLAVGTRNIRIANFWV